MPWSRRNETTWDYSSSDVNGFIKRIHRKNGTIGYEGLATNRKTMNIGPVVTGRTLTTCRAKFMRSVKALRK